MGQQLLAITKQRESLHSKDKMDESLELLQGELMVNLGKLLLKDILQTAKAKLSQEENLPKAVDESGKLWVALKHSEFGLIRMQIYVKIRPINLLWMEEITEPIGFILSYLFRYYYYYYFH